MDPILWLDITQGFFHNVVLDRNLFARADSSKGRFRSLLLHALNQYLLDEKRKENAVKRIPPDKLVSFAITDLAQLLQTIEDLDAEQSFNHVWKAEILKRAMDKTKDKYRKQGKETYWHLFQDRFLRPTLEGRTPPPLNELCERYGIDSEAKASNMINTVKKRVRRTLSSHVWQTVASDEQSTPASGVDCFF